MISVCNFNLLLFRDLCIAINSDIETISLVTIYFTTICEASTDSAEFASLVQWLPMCALLSQCGGVAGLNHLNHFKEISPLLAQGTGMAVICFLSKTQRKVLVGKTGASCR